MPETYTYESIAKMIDHSLLNPTLTTTELDSGCLLARTYDVASVCILPYYVERAVELLKGSTVQTSTTVGFPHGGHHPNIKMSEAMMAWSQGATEIDMVVNISKAKSGDWKYVKDEIGLVVRAAHSVGVKVKVIFENAYLTDDEKIRLCEICAECEADWVKTSTGYAPSGATMEDLALMRKHSPERVQVKAAGGVRDLDTLLKVRALGVTRVGATRTAAMLEDCRKRLGMAPLLIQGSSGETAGY